MSADRDGMERPKAFRARMGAVVIGPNPLPDEGPWSLMIFQGRVLTLSQISGLYEIEGVTLRKIELKPGEKP